MKSLLFVILILFGFWHYAAAQDVGNHSQVINLNSAVDTSTLNKKSSTALLASLSEISGRTVVAYLPTDFKSIYISFAAREMLLKDILSLIATSHQLGWGIYRDQIIFYRLGLSLAGGKNITDEITAKRRTHFIRLLSLTSMPQRQDLLSGKVIKLNDLTSEAFNELQAAVEYDQYSLSPPRQGVLVAWLECSPNFLAYAKNVDELKFRSFIPYVSRRESLLFETEPERNSLEFPDNENFNNELNKDMSWPTIEENHTSDIDKIPIANTKVLDFKGIHIWKLKDFIAEIEKSTGKQVRVASNLSNANLFISKANIEVSDALHLFLIAANVKTRKVQETIFFTVHSSHVDDILTDQWLSFVSAQALKYDIFDPKAFSLLDWRNKAFISFRSLTNKQQQYLIEVAGLASQEKANLLRNNPNILVRSSLGPVLRLGYCKMSSKELNKNIYELKYSVITPLYDSWSTVGAFN